MSTFNPSFSPSCFPSSKTHIHMKNHTQVQMYMHTPIYTHLHIHAMNIYMCTYTFVFTLMFTFVYSHGWPCMDSLCVCVYSLLAQFQQGVQPCSFLSGTFSLTACFARNTRDLTSTLLPSVTQVSALVPRLSIIHKGGWGLRTFCLSTMLVKVDTTRSHSSG